MKKESEINNIEAPLRCYARLGEKVAFAHCIDLNISAEGPDLKTAKERLEEAIADYIEAVHDTNDKESIPRLLKRSSPLRHHLFYHIIRLFRPNGRREVFTPCLRCIPGM